MSRASLPARTPASGGFVVGVAAGASAGDASAGGAASGAAASGGGASAASLVAAAIASLGGPRVDRGRGLGAAAARGVCGAVAAAERARQDAAATRAAAACGAVAAPGRVAPTREVTPLGRRLVVAPEPGDGERAAAEPDDQADARAPPATPGAAARDE